MREPYICPHCNHCSTRRWNLDVHIKRKHDDRPLGQLRTNNPPLYNQSAHLGHAAAADSIDNTFHPTFLPQQAVLGTSQYSANPIYPHVDLSQTFANPMYRHVSTTDGQRYGTGLSWGTVQKIQELKGLMNKYSYYHTNPDDIIRLAIYNSINRDDTLLDDKLEQLRSLDSLASI